MEGKAEYLSPQILSTVMESDEDQESSENGTEFFPPLQERTHKNAKANTNLRIILNVN